MPWESRRRYSVSLLVLSFVPAMISSLKINSFFLFLLSVSIALCKAGSVRRGRIVAQKRDAFSVPVIPTAPSLKDAASAILDDAAKLSMLPRDVAEFVLAVEHSIDHFESELGHCSTTSRPYPHSATSLTATSSLITSFPMPQIPPYPPSPTPSGSSTTYISRTTETITVQSTISVYLQSHSTRSSTGYASSGKPPQYTNTTSPSLTQTSSLNTSSTPISSQSFPTSSSPTSYSPSPSSTLTSSYTFNHDATDNVAVYYGQTQSTTAGGLLNLCQDPSVDIVILAFYEFFGPNGYPSIDFGPGCSGSTTEQTQSAPGLLNCSQLATEIAQCQAIGKPILLSLGGSTGITAFSSDDQATDFAATLWNLFGAGTAASHGLRPFGSVVLDGFDIDNEDHSTDHYDVFAAALRNQTAADPTRRYYISAAPQCPRPDASIPLGAMQAADFVWVQFYNNPPCNLGTAGFLDSFHAWSEDLMPNVSTGSGPRLYIGGGAWSGAGTGFVGGNDLAGIMGQVKNLDVPNFGGMMFWDGTEGLENMDGSGKDYLDYAKEALAS